jgi:hypothetical protein
VRRTSAVLLLTLALFLAVFGTPGHPLPARAADLAPVPAVPADSVVDSYGIGIHLAFLDTPYRDASAVADALAGLGVRHVRDDLFMDNPRQYAGIRTVAARGIRFDLIMGNPLSARSAADYVDTVARELPVGAVESLEGPNEWDLTGRDNWVAEMKTRQQQLYDAAAANAATADLPVLAPALAFRWNYAAAGDMSQHADVANAHMYPGGYKPSNQIPQITAAVREAIPDKPLVVTEAGYHNALDTTNGHRPVPEDVAAAYLPRLLLEHVRRGAERVYSYELIDEFDDPDRTDPEAHFGLLRRDLAPKPGYTAMKSLLGLLADPGPAFAPASLPVAVDGFPEDGRYLLTQKRTGQFVVLLWRDVALFDPERQVRLPVEPRNVTLRLAERADLRVYRPSQGPQSVTEVQATSVPLRLDGQVTAITIDAPTAPAPEAVSARPGNASATVSWQLSSTNNVTGFEIVRRPGAAQFTVPATARFLRDTGLSNGTRYRYTVRTLSADGSSPAVAAAPVTPATVPSRPRIASADAGQGSVTVRWLKANARGRPVVAYQVSWGTKTLRVGPGVRTATLTDLPRGRELRVAVRARNALGWGKAGYTRQVTTRR